MVTLVSDRELLQQGGEAAFLQPLVPANRAILSPCFVPAESRRSRERGWSLAALTTTAHHHVSAVELGIARATLHQQLEVTHPFRLVAIRTLVTFQPTPAREGRTTRLCPAKGSHPVRVGALAAGLHGTRERGRRASRAFSPFHRPEGASGT